MVKKTEDLIVSFAKRYKTYRFYRKHKWIRNIPFMALKYEWVMALWKNCLIDLKNSIWLLEEEEKQFLKSTQAKS